MNPFALAIRSLSLAACLVTIAATAGPDNNATPDPRIVFPFRTATDTSPPSLRDHISVDFPDTEIEEILRAVASRFGYTVNCKWHMSGRTSIKLREVSWIDVFREVLSPVGFDFFPDGSTIKVIGPDDPPAPLAQRQYRCIFGAPADFTELAMAECAKVGKGHAEIHGQAVAVSADWRTALDLDLIFGIWDRPRRIFPERIHIPSELPSQLKPPATPVQATAPAHTGSAQPEGPDYSTEISFTWIKADLAKPYLHTLLTEPGESIQQGICPNSLRITFRTAPWKHALLEEQCRYVDARKWYLTTDERDRAEELAGKIIGPPRHQPPQTEIEASRATGSLQSFGERADLISIDFPDEDCATVLKHTAAHFGRSVDLPNNFQGRTSIRLRNVTCWQVFREVLSPLGYDFYPSGPAIVVVPEGTPISRVYREYTCVYRPAAEFGELVHQLTADNHGTYEIVDRTVKARLAWARAERLDSTFKNWDRPPLAFPAVHWPDQLPPEIVAPSHNLSPERMPQDDPNDLPATTEIFILDWVSAQALANRIRPILASSQDRLQIDDTSNTLIITTDLQRQEIVGRICKYLDDRKRYLAPEERSMPPADRKPVE